MTGMHGGHDHRPHRAAGPSPARLAASATTHCLTGCAIGEALGLVIASLAGWGTAAAIALAVALAYCFGYALTILPLLRAGMPLRRAAALAFVSDTASITLMEIVDNAVMLAVPGAMEAPPDAALFWGAMAFSFAVAWGAAYPLNRWLIARGAGHAALPGNHA